jgi:hypothetical protein
MFHAGVARTSLTPFWGVELTGWGYYIERRWQRIHDPLNATALCFDDGRRQAIVVALDLMVIDEPFTRATRERIAAETGLEPGSIMLTCSHSHNAPAAGGLLGVGECDPAYEDWASRQAATAAILAWRDRAPATVRCGHNAVEGITYNRTRPHGVVDPHLTALELARRDGSTLAVVVNFGAHPTVYTQLRPWDVSRDVPGELCDLLEQTFRAPAVYIQGACGDVNFRREFLEPERASEPALRLMVATLDALKQAVPMADPAVAAASETAKVPTRRWTRKELDHDRREAERRLAGGDVDVSNWRETIGRAMTNRPDDMVRRHGGDERKAVRAMCRFHLEWTSRMLRDFETRPEVIETEVQAIKVGDVAFAANSSEFFSPFALDVRRKAGVPELVVACYANGRIGYMPDAHDIDTRTYAGYQSPKYCDQFPFTKESGPAMCAAMLRVIGRCRDQSPARAGSA